jgi:hypothetical protein
VIQLTRVSEDNKEVLHNLYQLYHYDFSQFTEEDINSSGLYEIPDNRLLLLTIIMYKIN